MRRLLLMVAVLAVGLTLAPVQEVRAKGLVFEKWAGDAFFAGNRPASSPQRWDIPAAEKQDHGAIPVNPKVDDQGQRRLPCSIRLRDVLQYLAPGVDPKPPEHPALFGPEYPGPIASRPRELKKSWTSAA